MLYVTVKTDECCWCWCLKGVVHGVTGIVTQPVSGAKQEGVSGFFKGWVSTHYLITFCMVLKVDFHAFCSTITDTYYGA